MRFRQSLAAALTAIVAATSLIACSQKDENTLTIVASATPHAEILEHLADTGALGDVKLDIKVKSGEIDANQLLVAGDVDANFFQHGPYLEDWLSQHPDEDLVSLVEVHLEPFALYSAKAKKLSEIPHGATIGIPKDVSNYARGLYLLADAGLIKLAQPREEADLTQISEKSITENPHNLKFLALPGVQLPRTFDDPKVDAVILNGNYALESGLSPVTDSLTKETTVNNPYTNILVVRKESIDDKRITTLSAALATPELARWIKERYKGAVVPVHKTQ